MTEPMTITIRTAQPHEFRTILAMWAEDRDHPPGVADDESGLTTLTADDAEALLVAEDETGIVGTLIAAWDGWRGNMYRLAVRRQYRRRGVALRLVLAGEERLRDKGARRVTALVDRDDATAVAFWEAAGYRLQTAMGRYLRNL
jgi:ribosomal protein S18 acetylase RimI-like enzyme